MKGVLPFRSKLSDSIVCGSNPCYLISSIHLFEEQTHRNVYNENGDITQTTTSRPQIGETLVAGRIDDEQTWDLDLVFPLFVDDRCLLLDRIPREEGGANLLCDTTCFTLLDRGLTDLGCQLTLQETRRESLLYRVTLSYPYRRDPGYNRWDS